MTLRWAATYPAVHAIQALDSTAGAVFANGFIIQQGTSVPDFSTGATPIANYKSFTQFRNEVASHTIHPQFAWVMYDIENWADTPPSEARDPWTAMQGFGQYAHAHGYNVIQTPARDLGSNPNSVHPKGPGETLEDWYLRTQIADVAGRYSDMIDIQAQALQADVTSFAAFAASARSQSLGANSYGTNLVGVSTDRGTAQQMADAAKSATFGGFWLNVPGPNPDYQEAVAFLRLYLGL